MKDKIIIKHLDDAGDVIKSKTVSEIITTAEFGDLFRISTSWSETLAFFSNAENTFVFEYDKGVSEAIKVTLLTFYKF